MILKGYLFSLLYGAVCLLLGFLLSKIPGCTKKITRKTVHILIGFEWVILYHYFGTKPHFLAVCLIFLALLILSYRKNLLPMISSEGDNAPGTVYYAVAMTIMAIVSLFLPDMILPFGIGVFCTSLGDGFAGLAGYLRDPDRYPLNRRIYGNKTAFGTAYNFVISSLVAFVFNEEFCLGMTLLQLVAIGLFSTVLELFTGRGLDNITVTLGTAFLTYFFIHFEGAENYIISILLTPAIIALAYNKKALTVGGIIAAIVVDILVSVSLGNFGFVTLFSFFVGGLITDKIKIRYKNSRQKSEKHFKKECRSSIQVFSNSFIPTCLAVAYFFTESHLFLITFVASLAEALADTTASGIGVLSGRAFDPFRMRRCEVGESGGMSLLGTAFSLIAAMLISSIALAFGRITLIEALFVSVAGFFGAIFDSLLGSLLQIKYKCTVCSKIIETKEHCNHIATKFRGISFVNNDLVNLLGTLFAAGWAGVLYSLT